MIAFSSISDVSLLEDDNKNVPLFYDSFHS